MEKRATMGVRPATMRIATRVSPGGSGWARTYAVFFLGNVPTRATGHTRTDRAYGDTGRYAYTLCAKMILSFRACTTDETDVVYNTPPHHLQTTCTDSYYNGLSLDSSKTSLRACIF